jgi:hypothetical protein
MELVVPNRLARNLGLEGREPLLRAFGAREIASGLITLSPDKRLGLWSRVAGDVLDMASLMPGLHPYNPKRGNAKLAQAVVIGVTALDVVAVLAASRRGRNSPERGAYRGRSGFPNGLSAARGLPGPGSLARRPAATRFRRPASKTARTSLPWAAGFVACAAPGVACRLETALNSAAHSPAIGERRSRLVAHVAALDTAWLERQVMWHSKRGSKR